MSAMQVANEISALAERVLGMTGGAGYKAPYTARAAGTFLLLQNTVLKLMFNIPADGDFYAERLNLFLQYRIIDVTSALASDRAFRPCNWSSVGDVVASTVLRGNSNAKISFRDDTNGKYQSAPFNVSALYSSRFGLTTGSFAGANTMFRGGLDFEIPQRIARGKAAELEVTPMYSAMGATVNAFLARNASNRIEFRVLGALRGYKNVRAFK